jgi:V-type H+-transporting ATPase subunit C
LTRINFSEAYQILAHLKTVRLFIESALRYGLPAEYAGVIIKVSHPLGLDRASLTIQPETKTAVSTLKTLSSHYSYLSAASQGPSSKKNKKSGGTTANSEDVGGEWQSVMEAEFYDFVLFEIPKVDF